LFNTYNFFALYANLVDFVYDPAQRKAVAEREELDQWIMSVMNSLIAEVKKQMDDYEPTRAVRAIDYFVNEQLSNWYVRLSRRRFWDGDPAAFQTLYECLRTVFQLMSPFAPFFSDKLYRDLTQGKEASSVHVSFYPEVEEQVIDLDAEKRQEMAQKITSLILSLRRKDKLKVRQPLAKAMVAVMDSSLAGQFELVKDLIGHEVNIKEIEYIREDNSILVKKIKPNFRVLGPKAGPMIKEIGPALATFSQEDIRQLEQEGKATLTLSSQTLDITTEDVEILSEDIPGWSVASDGVFTVALDITLTDDLTAEGIAREFVNRIQNLRKNNGFEVSDRINIRLSADAYWNKAVGNWSDYIQKETLGDSLLIEESVEGEEVDINGHKGQIHLAKV
ncbi:MAG: DUF5915 domain-containing protein, partial [Bacteroidota bacterium]